MNINALKKNKIELLAYITDAVLLVCHTWQFFDSNYRIEPLIRMIACAVYLVGALCFSRNFYYYFFTIFAYVIVCTNRFYNYTSFFIITLICYKKPSQKTVLYSLYAVDVVASLLIRDLSASHCIIHALNCICIYFIFNALVEEKVPELVLTNDEETIIKEMAEGTQQKAITSFSKNTVTKKLNEAKNRNNCLNTAELLYRYKNKK